jgi:hypothetical protein
MLHCQIQTRLQCEEHGSINAFVYKILLFSTMNLNADRLCIRRKRQTQTEFTTPKVASNQEQKQGKEKRNLYKLS